MKGHLAYQYQELRGCIYMEYLANWFVPVIHNSFSLLTGHEEEVMRLDGKPLIVYLRFPLRRGSGG
jgi:hypothetical protein